MRRRLTFDDEDPHLIRRLEPLDLSLVRALDDHPLHLHPLHIHQTRLRLQILYTRQDPVPAELLEARLDVEPEG